MSVNPTRDGQHFSKKTRFVRNLSESDRLHRVVQNAENHRNESGGDATAYPATHATEFTSVVFRILHYSPTAVQSVRREIAPRSDSPTVPRKQLCRKTDCMSNSHAMLFM